MITLDSFLQAVQDRDVIWPLAGSLLAGAVIGWERELKGKPAGLRTHTLVCFASALMTLVALRMAQWTVALPANTQIVSDMSRMPHAILTGIGFLGAGVIFREGANVHGLTTAASLWLTAALGIVFGSGLLELAVLGSLIAVLVLGLLRVAQRLIRQPQVWQLDLCCRRDGGLDLAQLTARLNGAGLRVVPGQISLRRDRAPDGQVTSLVQYSLQLSGWLQGQGAGRSPDALCAELADIAGVISLSLTAEPHSG